MTHSTSPKYRRQRRRGKPDLDFVELGGQRHYLGPHGSAESRQEYHRLLAEWTATGGRPPVAQDFITVVELIDRFWQHVKNTYRDRNGSPSNHAEKIRLAFNPVKMLYGKAAADAFGPLALKAVRDLIMTAAPGGRYILACSDTITADWSEPNIRALFNAAWKYGDYEHLGVA